MLLYSSAYHDARFGTVGFGVNQGQVEGTSTTFGTCKFFGFVCDNLGLFLLDKIYSLILLHPSDHCRQSNLLLKYSFVMANLEWQALESNPDTINLLMAKIGVETVECVDIISFDDEVLKDLPKPQLAVLLCLPDYEKVHALMAPVYDKLFSESVTAPENVFFMEQKIGNACGTFALFHALANVEDLVDLGSGPFRKWLEAAKGVRVDQRSALLANDSSLAAAHNEAAILGVSRQPAEVVHHFICYVNRDGTLFEIDSRAPFPRAIGVTSGDTLVKDAGAACKCLMDELHSVSFAAMALLPKN